MNWISLIALVFAVALTLLIYLEQPHKKEVRKLEKMYKEFLTKRDNQINELQQKGDVLFKTALKRTQADLELAELKRKLEEKKE